MRVFVDTNVLVSALTARGLSADVLRIIITEHELLTGETNLVELRRVLHEKMRVPKVAIDEVELLLREHEIVPKPREVLGVEVRDRDDAWVLAAAVAANADVLVTGDKDLLVLKHRAPLPIVDPRGFWEMARKRK